MWAVSTNCNVTTVGHIVNRVTMLAEDPHLRHVASLTIGGRDGENRNDRLLVDGRQATPQDVTFGSHEQVC